MGESNFFITIGYPLGLDRNIGKLSAYIENGENMIILKPEEFAVWQLAFVGIPKEEVISEYNKQYDDNRCEEIIEKLKNESLLMEMEHKEDLQEYFDIIKKYRVIRQGFGMGTSDLDCNEYVIISTDEVTLDEDEYRIWAFANGQARVNEIYENISYVRFDESSFIKVLLMLYDKNLIYFEK